jgi:hypothetical protein
MRRLDRRWSDPLLLAAFFLCVYLVSGSADLLQNGDTDLRIQTAQAFVDHGRLWIAHPMWLDNRTAVGRGGHLYAYYAPGQEVLTVPLYILGQVLFQAMNIHYDLGTLNVVTLYATRSLDLILGAILAAVFYLMAVSIGFRRNSAVVLTLVFGLATATWPDAQSALEQTQVDLALLLAVLAEWTFVNRGMSNRWWLILSGASLGFGVLTRYDFAIYLVPAVLFPVALRFACRRRGAVLDMLAFAAGIVPGFLLIGLWNWLRFGNVLTTGLHERTFGEPPLLGLASILVSPGKGLVWYVPILFLLPWAVPAFVRRVPALSLLFFALFLFPLMFYSTIFYWHGDPAWGPRYIYVAIPYLVLPLGEIVDRWRVRAAPLKVAAVALVAVSIAIQVAAVSVTPWRFWYHQEVLRQRSANAEAWTGQPFHWGPRRYHYYWTVSESPIIQQFVGLYQVLRLDGGDQHYLLAGQPDPYVSSPVPNYPVNSLLFWWTDERHPVLGPHTRAGLAALLGLIGLLSLLGLIWTMARPGLAGTRLAPIETPVAEPRAHPVERTRLVSGED